MVTALKNEELIADAKLFFETYKKKIGESIRKARKTVFIEFEDLASNSPILAEALISSPEEVLQLLEVALEDTGLIKNPRIRFKDLPGTQKVRIRTIRAEHLNKLIFFEGLVRQASEVRPQVVNARFECPSCGTVISVLQIEKKFREPSRCSCGRKGQFRLISKIMVDAQRLVIEESPESLIGGEQPRRMNVFLKEDLVEPIMEEKTTPGSKVRVLGILKEVPVPLPTGAISTRFDLAIEANNVIPMETTYEELDISEEDERQIEELAADPEVFRKLRDSIAPSIWGYEEIKEALVLQMFGGVRKISDDGTVSRGDTHVFLIGDPGCLVADERIVLDNGAIVRMNKLGKEHLQKINISVLTGEGNRKRDYAKVFHIYKKQPIIEIITESGKSIKGTYNHPLLNVYKKDGKSLRKWKRLDEFKIRDRVAVTTSIPCTITKYMPTNFKPLERKYGPRFKAKLPKCLDPKLASLLGYILGDGWVSKYKTGFVIAESEIDIINTLIKICKEIFNITPKIMERKRPDRKVKLYYVEINSADISNCLKFLREKRVPEIIMESGNKVASSFLKWLYEADGTVFNNGRGRRAVSFKAKNIELLKDIQILLLRFHIHSRIIGDALMIRRGRDIIKFADKIGFVSKKKTTKLKDLSRDAELFKRTKSKRSERIIKIIKHNELEDVYDIEVPISNRFIANGIISHNTAKSQTLKFISNVAPKGRYVVGMSTSGRGITATVVRDEFLKGWSLEAGAMVLANKGVVCIDEIEKMTPEDRSAMHEALEQQTVTISKANVQATLQSQVSVLAAGNPKYGRFEPLQSITEQIDLPPALINRFDLIFIVRDLPNVAQDNEIATHVLHLHQMKDVKPDISQELFKKYVAYAKQKIIPKLTDEAVEEIKQFYIKMRKASLEGESRSISISARQLQGLVRLAEAHAKSRLSQTVDVEDARVAIRLTNYYLMQVGYDPETKKFDIDRFTTRVSSSQRSKIILLKESIKKLEERYGKQIPIEELKKELKDFSDTEFEEAIEKLKKSGDVFQPKQGFVQDVQSR